MYKGQRNIGWKIEQRKEHALPVELDWQGIVSYSSYSLSPFRILNDLLFHFVNIRLCQTCAIVNVLWIDLLR